MQRYKMLRNLPCIASQRVLFVTIVEKQAAGRCHLIAFIQPIIRHRLCRGFLHRYANINQLAFGTDVNERHAPIFAKWLQLISDKIGGGLKLWQHCLLSKLDEFYLCQFFCFQIRRVLTSENPSIRVLTILWPVWPFAALR